MKPLKDFYESGMEFVSVVNVVQAFHKATAQGCQSLSFTTDEYEYFIRYFDMKIPSRHSSFLLEKRSRAPRNKHCPRTCSPPPLPTPSTPFAIWG